MSYNDFNKINENVFKKFFYWLLESPGDEEFKNEVEDILKDYKKNQPSNYKDLLKILRDQGIVDKNDKIIKPGIIRVFNTKPPINWEDYIQE